ncbi:MAG TPA: PrgI family protein [bacterium]|nr:PrgI family protein [bacterium]
MRFKVPQNIDMQDRILGPLTMVQFIYAVIGFGICYSIFMSIPTPFSYALIAPIALFIFCLDFVKVNERPFLDFFVAALEYLGAPKKRLWLQGSDTDFQIELYHQQKNNNQKVKLKEVSTEEIADLARGIDTNHQDLIRK